MRTIQKETLDRLIMLERKYFLTGNEDLLDPHLEACKELSTQAYGRDNYWMAFFDLVSGIAGGICSLNPGISDASLYEIMRILGYEVVDGKEGEE